MALVSAWDTFPGRLGRRLHAQFVIRNLDSHLSSTFLAIGISLVVAHVSLSHMVFLRSRESRGRYPQEVIASVVINVMEKVVKSRRINTALPEAFKYILMIFFFLPEDPIVNLPLLELQHFLRILVKVDRLPLELLDCTLIITLKYRRLQ